MPSSRKVDLLNVGEAQSLGSKPVQAARHAPTMASELSSGRRTGKPSCRWSRTRSTGFSSGESGGSGTRVTLSGMRGPCRWQSVRRTSSAPAPQIARDESGWRAAAGSRPAPPAGFVRLRAAVGPWRRAKHDVVVQPVVALYRAEVIQHAVWLYTASASACTTWSGAWSSIGRNNASSRVAVRDDPGSGRGCRIDKTGNQPIAL